MIQATVNMTWNHLHNVVFIIDRFLLKLRITESEMFVCLLKGKCGLDLGSSELIGERVKLFVGDLIDNRLISSKQLNHHLSQLQRQSSL